MKSIAKTVCAVSWNPQISKHRPAPLKPIMVGSATLLAALIAAPQLVNLKHVISDVKLPEFSLGIIPLNDMSMSTLAMSTLLAVMAAGVATSLWFSEDM